MGISLPPWRRCLAQWLALVCVFGLCSAAQAQWKWRDKDGRVTASDLPPPRDVADKDILARPGLAKPSSTRATPAAATASTASSKGSAGPASAPVERELEARKKATEQEKAAKFKAEEERVAAQRADNCRRARSQLSALESGVRIARINDKGEREILDDQGRADELRRAREVTVSDCR